MFSSPMRTKYSSFWLFFIIMMLTRLISAQDMHQTLPDATKSTFNSTLQHFLRTEDANRTADEMASRGWVVDIPSSPTNCLASDSGSKVLAPFACKAYTANGYYSVQASAGIDLGASPGPACANDDLAWVIIADGNPLVLPGANFVKIGTTDYYVDCTTVLQPATPSNATILFAAHIVSGATIIVDLRPLGPGLPSRRNAHGSSRTLAEEAQAWAGDAFIGYVPVPGCLHGVSGTTSATIASCSAYTLDTATPRKLRYIEEPIAKTITYTAGDGAYWLIAHSDISTEPAGWTRVKATHYLWQKMDIRPTLPTKGLFLAHVTVLGGAITVIGDLRQDNPRAGSPINVLSPIYGVVGDNVTDDTAALQAALNAASWQRRRSVNIPMAPLGDCYAYTRLFFHNDPTDNPGWNPDENAQGRIVLTGEGSLTLRDQVQDVPFGTCLRSTHAVGPGINILSQVAGVVHNSQRTELRDIHFKANNTTAVIRAAATSTNSWHNVSVEQEDNTIGNGVEIQDSFIFLWEGGSVLGAAQLPTGTGIGVHITMPETQVAGLVEFRNMTIRQWGTCWQYGDDILEGHRLANLKFDQVQARHCSTHAMLLWGTLQALSVTNSYFEAYASGISIAGNNRAIDLSKNYFAGTFVNAGRANVAIGIGTAVAAPKTARQVSIRLNSFSSVAEGTTGVRLDVRNTADNGREVAFNEFIGIGTSIEVRSNGGNLHQLYVYGNDYGTAPPEQHLVFTDITPGDPDGRVDYYGQDGFTTLASLQQRLISNRIDVVGTTDTAIILNSGANLQRFQVTGGTATIDTITWAGGTPTTGTEFCLIREQASQNLIFVEGGNIQLDGGTSKTLTAEGSNICFVYFNAAYRQSRALVQHN